MTKRSVRRNMTRKLGVLESLESRYLLAGISMTADEQLLLELVNRARSNPAAEAARYSIDLNAGLAPGTISSASKQPLAPDQFLTNAAGLHSQDMLDRDYFAHDTPEGKTPWQRAAEAGYQGFASGENLALGYSFDPINLTDQVPERHASLVHSPGHRANMLNPSQFEMGLGVRSGKFPYQGNELNAAMVTEVFGSTANKVFLTGVAYSDAVLRDDFFTVGEEFANVLVRAKSQTGVNYETTTGPSGGYALAIPNGSYDLIFSHPNKQGEVIRKGIQISNANVKVDLNLATATWTGPRNLKLTLDRTSIAENAGAGAATLTITRFESDLSKSVAVSITSSDTSEVSLPSVVVIPAGQSSVVVGVNAVDDALFDGTQAVTLNATADGYTDSTVQLSVTDYQPLAIVLQFTQLYEELTNQSSTNAQISLRSPAPATGLVITLTTNVPGQLNFPPTVFVSAGETKVDFRVSIVDDFTPQGTRHARIDATALGAIAAAVDLVLSDSDPALWTNLNNPYDVDGSGMLDPLDVLVIINELNTKGARSLNPTTDFNSLFIDTNADGSVDPLDVLQLINKINAK